MEVTEKKKIKRSRNGCHNCKRLKIKCDELKPKCSYCTKTQAECDYSIKLTWGGRPFKDASKRTKDPFQMNMVTFDLAKPIKRRKVDSNSLAPSPAGNTNAIYLQPKYPSPSTESLLDQHFDTSERLLSGQLTSNFSSHLLPGNFTATEKSIPVEHMHVEMKVTPSANSPPSFLTPNGQSILSESKDYTQQFKAEDFQYNDNVNTSNPYVNETYGSAHVENQQYSLPEGVFTKPLKQPFLLIDSIPEISDGIESLSNALDKMTNGAFKLENSEIFNSFVSNFDGLDGLDIIDNGIAKEADRPAEFGKFLSDYSEDLARIENYMPTRLDNFGPEFSYATNHFRLKEVEQGENLEDEEVDYELITPNTLFSLVPAQFLPLPELLLGIPFYRHLMHFWVHTASHHLVPAPAHIYKENPFRVILPQMAMAYPSILTTLLAFSATIRSRLIGRNDTPDFVLDQLLSRSCTELLKLLRNSEEATLDASLATVLLLSCYEVFVSKDLSRHRAHTIGARQIVMARSQETCTPTVGNESDITFFLMRWFVYVDVIGALSATKNSENYLSAQPFEVDRKNAYEPAKEVECINETEEHYTDPKRDIDHILGFDIRFLPQFSEIAFLIRETDMYLSNNTGEITKIPIELSTRALEVLDCIARDYEAGEKRRQIQLDEIMDYKTQEKETESKSDSPPNFKSLILQDNILRATNKVFYIMARINLYRRVFRVPRASALIQTLTNESMTTIREYIESTSPADICTIFCSFTAACESLDVEAQDFFTERFSRLQKMGNHSAGLGLQIMTKCWESGDDWLDVSKNLNVDMALL